MLISDNQTHVFVDGGMTSSYKGHVAKAMGSIRNAGQELDLVCVSHIDQDHILGILQMLNDEMDWRVYDYQRSRNNRRARKPSRTRPPKIKEIWHNAFHEQISENTGRIEDMLAAYTQIFLNTDIAEEVRVGDEALSTKQAIQVSRRLQAKQLDIDLNAKFNGGLVMRKDPGNTYRVGRLRITVIGPTQKDLYRLRKEWNGWLEESSHVIRRIRETAREDKRSIGNDTIPWFGAMLELSRGIASRGGVTIPNLASIMFLVEFGRKSVLMTGDGHAKDILIGLEKVKKLNQNGSIHVNVLKIPHHGSTHNFTKNFYRKVTADHYVFCGNGANTNPEKEVVKSFIDSRVSNGELRALTSQRGNRFKLWFNSSEDVASKSSYRKHMGELEDLVKREARSHNRISYKFMGPNQSQLKFSI